MPFEINHKHNCYFYGSCFSEHFYDLLNQHRFNVLHNSHGILFNPISIEKAITDIVQQKTYTKDDIFCENEIWSSFHHHSSFSNTSSKQVLEKINTTIEQHQDFLQQTSIVFITLGTAWVYEQKETNTVVANCHKIPQINFTKRLLDLQEITVSLQSIIDLCKSLNKNVKVVFTLSPVRHLKDGFEENSLSKALLRAAIALINQQKQTHYFPSYELMMDDLRDYRFYANDLLHPNDLAIDYIWQQFQHVFFNENTKSLVYRIAKLNKAKAHRPHFPNTEAYQKHLAFIEREEQTINELLN